MVAPEPNRSICCHSPGRVFSGQRPDPGGEDLLFKYSAKRYSVLHSGRLPSSTTADRFTARSGCSPGANASFHRTPARISAVAIKVQEDFVGQRRFLANQPLPQGNRLPIVAAGVTDEDSRHAITVSYAPLRFLRHSNMCGISLVLADAGPVQDLESAVTAVSVPRNASGTVRRERAIVRLCHPPQSSHRRGGR